MKVFFCIVIWSELSREIKMKAAEMRLARIPLMSTHHNLSEPWPGPNCFSPAFIPHSPDKCTDGTEFSIPFLHKEVNAPVLFFTNSVADTMVNGKT